MSDQIYIAKLKKEGHTFEIDIDPDKALAYRDGSNTDIKSTLKAENIFSDVKKGKLASSNVLKEVFETEDPLQVASIILKKGEIQTTAEHRQKLRDMKRKKILNIIHTNAVDPKTHLPHPMTRLESAFEEAKIRIAEDEPAEKQIQPIIKKLRPILPIKFEVKEILVKIGSLYAAKSYSAIKSFGKMMKDEWQNDGSWICQVEIPGGLEEDFYDKLNSLTHGSVETKVINTR